MRKIIGGMLVAALLTSACPAAMAQSQTQSQPADAPGTTVVIEGQKASKAAPEWIKGESQHFIVYSNVHAADVKVLIDKLERFHYMLRAVAHLENQPEADAPKLELYYLADPKQLDIVAPAKPDYGIGLYKSCADGEQAYASYMYYRPEDKAALEKQPENEGMSYVFQAYARHFLYLNDSRRTPLWFIDGFADYFSTARLDGNDAVVGMAPEPFAAFMQRASVSGDLTPALTYKDILLQNETHGFSDAGEDGVRTEFQARSWMLTHWILSSPENRGKFTAYLTAVANGDAPVPAFETAFGMPMSRVADQLSSYLRGRHLMAMKMHFEAPAQTPATFDAMPVSANKLLLWNSALKGCPTAAYGATLLGEIRAEAPKYPQSELAQTTLARAEILYGDPQRALPYLNKLAGDQPNDFEAQALLGRAELAIARTATGDARAAAFTAAKQAMVKAAQIDATEPANIHAYYRAQVLSYDTPNEAATSAAELAWHLAPDVDSYALAAGLSYAYLGRKADALTVLHTVADDPRGRSLAGVARTWIDRITAGAGPAEIAAAIKADEVAPEGGRMLWTLSSHDILQTLTQKAAEQEIREYDEFAPIPITPGAPSQ